MSEQCANCGQEITHVFVLDTDSMVVVGRWLWRSPDAEAACFWVDPSAPPQEDPRYLDYHQPIERGDSR